MNDLATLLTNFDVSVLFAVTKKLADLVGAFLSPVLLVIAIYIRLMETQIDGLTGGGKYGTALRDMVLWSFALGAYYGIGAYIMDFFNPVYEWLDSFGSLAATMKSFSSVMAKNKIVSDANGMTLIGVISSPYALIAMFLYYFSLVIVAFLTAFLKIANVMAFGVAFVWGLIAIPVSISTTFKILRGWAYLLALALVWPIVQGLMMAMFAMLFSSSTDTLMAVSDTDATVRGANIMLLFSVMHLLLAAVMVSAPLIASSLVTNSPAGAAVVMPFVAAAASAGMATIRGTQASGGISGGASSGSIVRLAGSSNVNRTPTMRAATASFASSAGRAPSSSSSDKVAASGSTGSGSTSTTTPAPSKPAAAVQQRRGAIIRQQIKRG